MRYPKHLILDVSTPSAPIMSSLRYNLVVNQSNKLTDELTSHASTSIITRVSTSNRNGFDKSSSNTFYSTTNTFDINFLRKEKLYTKLKYSRCPQYDIVSGGFAAILAGFVGFLISEKFGIELVDSGDFYIAFMYGVIASFSVRPLVRIYSKDSSTYTPFSLNYLLTFLHDLVLLTLAELKAAWYRVTRRS